MNKDDLMKFCKPEHHAFKEPFSAGNYTYATDGSILIRIKRLDDVPENPASPAPGNLFNKDKEAEYDIHPAPDSVEPKTVECTDCEGVGVNAKCPECGGRGEVSLSNDYSDYEFDCRSCGGSGKVEECENCEGTGKVEILTKIPIGHVLFSAKYLFMLKQIGVASIAIPKPTSDIFRFEPAYFWFPGGDGLLMPVRD